MPFILYVYLLLFIKFSLSKINAIKLITSLLLKLFKEYDLDTEYCLKNCVCESRDMSDGSGGYIILLKLKTILFTWS